jgi:glycosyltransferase involved in cell wall biosynthesis
LLPHKNHRRLLEAMARIEDRTLHLVLTGPGLGGVASLRHSVAELGLGERVHHLGYRPRSDVPVLLRRSVALVFPSLYEGFGTPPLEAMACGTPVVSSLCASLRDVCEGAVCVVEPRDVDSVVAAIDAVTRDDRLRRDLVKRGTERVAGYTWSAAAAAHADAYRLARSLRS